jgi:peptidoglycan/xylan/chitin deacetylase (PgdA/CDA1 family)
MRLHKLRKLKKLTSFLLVIMGRLRSTDVTPILLYHSVDTSNSVISVYPEQFKRQMRYLKEQGYRTIPLAHYVDCLRTGAKAPPKSVVITFDDGFKNNYTEAFPILKRNGYTATIFLSTGQVGGKSTWERHPSIPELPMLSWDEITEMSDYGIWFESHAHRHCFMSQLSEDEARQELMESKAKIEGATGRKVNFFCHPYGDWSERTKQLVKECGYLAAFTRPGFNSRNTGEDMYDLKRVGTAQFSSLEDFRAGIMGTYDWYVRVKEFLGVNRFRDLRIKELRN